MEKNGDVAVFAIALGGDWEYRSYEDWPIVIEKLLIDNKQLNIVLLGSNNANDINKKILEKFPSANILSYVDKLTFNQTAEIIKNAQLLLCCDGGLMHAANAVSTKIIPLFKKEFLRSYQNYVVPKAKYFFYNFLLFPNSD